MGSSSFVYNCLCGSRLAVDEFFSRKMLQCPSCRKFVILPSERDGVASYPQFEFETSRLALRLARRKDWRALHEVYNAPQNFAYELSQPDTERGTRDKIRRSLFPSKFAKSNILLFTLCKREENEILGAISVTFKLPYYAADLGFMLRTDCQNQGFGTESVAGICQFLFQRIGVEKISAMTDAKNKACRTVLEKTGFTREGYLNKFFHHPERGWLDAPLYSLFASPPDATSEA
ncbi:GNAT family N-acetyltransferase [Roseibacillus persicicus]|uniref:GNAT family N-acetyltransferase n=1 Tax=Roseibacillus persicicus TaxID=454148 RepID=UPI00398AF4AA